LTVHFAIRARGQRIAKPGAESKGKSGEIGWQFTHAGEFYYGCLIPGHFDAGMIGKVTVRR
jgi:uncharacterized cupredoxin-like copper-binding protein